MQRKTLIIALCALLFFCHHGVVKAWGQTTHQEINRQATLVFANKFAALEKYRLGPVTLDGLQDSLRGIRVTSSTRFIQPGYGAQLIAGSYKMREHSANMLYWIEMGGNWADEPHIYMSLRHFYDPLALSGHSYLTDQFTVTQIYETPGIDARTWGLSHDDNPFNFYQALLHYKLAMETPETEEPRERIQQEHFRLLPLTPKDREDERNIYLGRAYRALGETMHMLGDMTQPAHVRNDAHPRSEPVEDNIKAQDVAMAAGYPVDSRVGQYLLSSGAENSLPPGQLFDTVARFVNSNFYSNDTIYDQAEGIKPLNWEQPYPRPQFSNLVKEEINIPCAVTGIDRTALKYSGLFVDGSVPVPMAQQKLSAFIIPWLTELAAQEMNYLPKYHIPPSFAQEQGRVLLPIAIHANADLMHMFYPTLELQAGYEDMGLQQEPTLEGESVERRVIETAVRMVHHQEQDIAWKEAGLQIQYSGPGVVLFENGGRVRKKIDLHFLDGVIDKVEAYDGEMEALPLKFYLTDDGRVQLPEEEAHFQVMDGDKIYIMIEGGSRKFTAPRLIYEFAGESIDAQFVDLGVRANPESQNPAFGIREIAVAARVVNGEQPENTPQEIYLPTEYTGAANLVFEKEGKRSRVVALKFEQGQLTQILNGQQVMEEKELKLYIDDSLGQVKLTEEEKIYQIQPGESVYLEIEAWGKKLVSQVWADERKEEGIEGSYTGYIVIEEANKIREFIINMLMPFGKMTTRIFGSDASDEEIRAVLESAITEEGVGRQVGFGLEIAHAEGDVYRINSYVEGDAGWTESTGSGVFQNGILRFDLEFSDGSSFQMEGRLRDADVLEGVFSASAWGFIKDAMTGHWVVTRGK